MRLLIINPNTSFGVTARIREAAEAVALPGDHFTTTCPDFGPNLIVTQADTEEANRGVLAKVRDHAAPCDGIVLASFGNTGADAVRALRKDIPVIGIAEAAFAVARKIEGPFGIVTFGAGLVPGLRAEVEAEGLTGAMLGISHLEHSDFGDAATVQHRFHAELVGHCVQMHERGARSIVMGGGPLAGFAQSVSGLLPIPVIDGTQAAIAQMREIMATPANPLLRPKATS